MLINGLEKCPCKKKDCDIRGKCEECIERHKSDKKRPLPYCERKKEKQSKK